MRLIRIVGAGGLSVCVEHTYGDDHMLARRSVQESQDGDRREVVEIGRDAARRVKMSHQQMFLRNVKRQVL